MKSSGKAHAPICLSAEVPRDQSTGPQPRPKTPQPVAPPSVAPSTVEDEVLYQGGLVVDLEEDELESRASSNQLTDVPPSPPSPITPAETVLVSEDEELVGTVQRDRALYSPTDHGEGLRARVPYTAEILAAIERFDVDRLKPMLTPQTEHELTEQSRQITVAIGWLERELKVRMRAEKDMWRDKDTFWNTFMNRLWIAASQGVPLDNTTGTLKEHFDTTNQVLLSC